MHFHRGELIFNWMQQSASFASMTPPPRNSIRSRAKGFSRDEWHEIRGRFSSIACASLLDARSRFGARRRGERDLPAVGVPKQERGFSDRSEYRSYVCAFIGNAVPVRRVGLSRPRRATA